MKRNSRLTRCVVAMAVFSLPGLTVAADDGKVDARWLDRMEDIDRTLLEENVGHAPPQMTAGLKWLAGAATSWDDLRGKVVIVQSWTMANGVGRGAPDRAQRAAEMLNAGDDVVVLAVHTPESADEAAEYIGKRGFDIPVILDEQGLFCDEFGFYKRPTNVVIDRNGFVRYAGLNTRGLNEAAKSLLGEAFDPAKKPEPRPKQEEPAGESAGDAEFPTFTGVVQSANDLRGKRAPEMYVQQWLSGTPNARGKVTVIDFWATWCGPCVRAIPHMNELAAQFRNDVVCVGLSNEEAGTVQNFMRSTPMNYYVAVDQQARVQKGFGVTGIPHVAVISSDWVVRWQGHAANLTPQILQQIVDANRKLAAASGESDGGRYRWTGGA